MQRRWILEALSQTVLRKEVKRTNNQRVAWTKCQQAKGLNSLSGVCVCNSKTYGVCLTPQQLLMLTVSRGTVPQPPAARRQVAAGGA